jgi:membrane-bound metal-dependent hydrolase YbcI (DUF457 family)
MVVGVIVVATAFWLGMFGVRYELILLAELAVIVGGIAPDIDSDTSVPFHFTLSAVSLFSGFVAAMHAWRTVPGDWWRLAGYAVLGAAFVWVVVGGLFKKFTHHRGMVHSIPAAVLAGLILYTAMASLHFSGFEPFLISVAMTLGYLLHLLLDEIYAGVNFNGHLFVPNKAFGSALKFWSGKHALDFGVYAVIFALAYLRRDEFTALVGELAQSVRSGFIS